MDTKEVIDNLFVEVMSEMGFVDVVPVSDGVVIIDPVAIKMGIMMPYLGDVVVVFSRPLAVKFAMNLSVTTEMESLEQGITDSASEFVNVFVGKLVEKLYPTVLFELGLPTRIDLSKLNKDGFVVHHYTDPENQRVSVFRKFHEIKK